MLSIMTLSMLLFMAEKESALEEEGVAAVEQQQKQQLSFFDCLWWCIMAMSTVRSQKEGAPKTSVGKLIGCVCAVVGMIIFTLPIPIIVNSFANTYKNKLISRELLLKQQRTEKIGRTNAFLGLKGNNT